MAFFISVGLFLSLISFVFSYTYLKLSLKEIAEIRKTTEKTARAQSVAVYAKAGLGGRSELAAFFLEDLLLPSDITSPQ